MEDDISERIEHLLSSGRFELGYTAVVKSSDLDKPAAWFRQQKLKGGSSDKDFVVLTVDGGKTRVYRPASSEDISNLTKCLADGGDLAPWPW